MLFPALPLVCLEPEASEEGAACCGAGVSGPSVSLAAEVGPGGMLGLNIVPDDPSETVMAGSGLAAVAGLFVLLAELGLDA